jgi:Ni/Co efflux regulator RcnB
MKKTLLACTCVLLLSTGGAFAVRTNAAGPRRIQRRKRRPRRDQKHDRAHEHEKGNDDRNLDRQNEVGQFVQQQSFQHGQCRIRHQKIIRPAARWLLDPQRECRPRAAAFTSFVCDELPVFPHDAGAQCSRLELRMLPAGP